MSRSKNRRSFSMVELMVVIAIIALIAALLAPALRSAKYNALDIKCSSNQRQIHTAIYLYAADNNHMYPEITWDQQYKQITLFSNYIGLTFYRCPLATENLQTDPFWGPKISLTVGTNFYWTEYKVGDNTDMIGKSLARHLRPSKVVYVMDSADWSPRHRGKSNLCFGDGHVEAMTYQQYNDAGNAPEPGSPTGNPKPWYNWGLYPY